MILPVPVKPFVRHLLIEHYGKPPISIRSNSDLGNIFLLATTDKSYLRLMFGYDVKEPLPPTGQSETAQMRDERQAVIVEAPEGLVEISFDLGGKFDKTIVLPDMLEQLGKSLESYCRIFMKGYMTGYRMLLNSSHSSSISFHHLYSFKEDDLTHDNVIKIFQREWSELKDPFTKKERRRQNIRLVVK